MTLALGPRSRIDRIAAKDVPANATLAPMAERTFSVKVTRVSGVQSSAGDDLVVVEEPLEIRIAWDSGEPREKTISVTMRTPGDDPDLAAGFLFTEGLIASAEDVESTRHWASPNVIRVALRKGARVDTSKLDRHFYTTSSCGVCGKTSIDALRVATLSSPKKTRPVSDEIVHTLPRRLEEHQSAFQATGALHGAAIFDVNGVLLRAREDIGRHNAVDKVIGSLFSENRTPLTDTILMVSSRASFEIVQKAVVAGIPAVASVGAPSTLAVDLAREFGVTLMGFVRDERFNRYC
jgi:FdhD protein